MGQPAVNTVSSIEVIPTGAALGAQVRGIDLSRPLDEAARQRLREAWAEHLVLLFRDQQLSDHDILEFCQVFGGLQIPAARRFWEAKGHKPGEFGVSEIPEISELSNLGPDGKPTRDNGDLGSSEDLCRSSSSRRGTETVGCWRWPGSRLRRFANGHRVEHELHGSGVCEQCRVSCSNRL